MRSAGNCSSLLHFALVAPFRSSICIYYWPSARSRWLDIGRVLFLRFMDRDEVEVHKNAKRERGQYPATLDRTRLVNKRFILWRKEHWKKWSSYLFIFELWKGNQLHAKVMARAPISWLDKCRKYNRFIGCISNSNFKFKFSSSKQTFVFASLCCKTYF